MEFITYRHSFNAGDLLTVLSGIRNQYLKTGKKAIIYQRLDLLADYGNSDHHPIKSESGAAVCMNRKVFDMLKPLIESQEYVERFEIWEGQDFDVDYDLTRQHSQMPLPGGNIYYWPTLIYPQLAPLLNEPWLDARDEVIDSKDSFKIVVNFTERYRNPYISYFFLKPHEKDILFIGTEIEHELFSNKNNLEIKRYEVANFRELACIIKISRFFIGCQSFCFHLAQAMDIPRILELCSAYPNTFPSNTNGHAFITQKSLEHYFNKLIKETE